MDDALHWAQEIQLFILAHTIYSSMYQPVDATLGSAQPMGTPANDVSHLPPQLPVATAAAEASVFFVETTNTYLPHTITPLPTTGAYTHTTTAYPYHSMNNQTSTTDSLITPILNTHTSTASPPGPSHEVLNLSHNDPDCDHERENAPIRTQRMGFGSINIYDVSVFTMVNDAFVFTINITNVKAPTIPAEYRVRFERILCNAYRRSNPTPGGVLITSQDEYLVYAIMVTGSRQEVVGHIKTGLEEVRAHARLRRVSTLSFSRLGSRKTLCQWKQIEDIIYHLFWQDTVTINMYHC